MITHFTLDKCDYREIINFHFYGTKLSLVYITFSKQSIISFKSIARS
jgi:hypothetical protein